MKLGSLFSGSGGFELAGILNGIEPKWASEIEAYPIAVTTSHFPRLEHLGNVSHINGAEITPVDVISFGSPCQDLSVAGKQAGIHEGKRSSLFFEAIRIIREMRCVTNGKYPRFAVFENVPGLFSTGKGEDFRAVLQAFVDLRDDSVVVPEPPKGRWLHAGEIVGDDYSIAWRVQGAEHWGVPQRRNRIYLVADLAGRRAGEVLFEQESLRRNPAPSAAQGKGTASDAERSAGGSAGFLKGQGVSAHGIGYEEEKTPTLRSQEGGNSVPCVICKTEREQPVVYDTTQITSPENGYNPKPGNPSHPLCASAHVPLLIEPTVCNESGQGYWMPGFGCIRAEGENRPSRPGHLVYALQGNGIDRCETAGCNGCGWKPNTSYTLNTIDRHAVCYQEIVGSLCAADWRGPNSQYVGADKLVVDSVCTDARGNGDGKTCSTMTGAHESSVSDYTNIVTYGGDKAGTLDASYYKGAGTRNGKEREFIAEIKPDRKYIVRRLTTTECARLQGFPDCWGIPLHKEEFTDEEASFWEGVRQGIAEINHKQYRPYSSRDQLVRWYNRLHTDSSEYKLYGNGIALPCAAFVLHGIAMVLSEEGTTCE